MNHCFSQLNFSRLILIAQTSDIPRNGGSYRQVKTSGETENELKMAASCGRHFRRFLLFTRGKNVWTFRYSSFNDQTFYRPLLASYKTLQTSCTCASGQTKRYMYVIQKGGGGKGVPRAGGAPASKGVTSAREAVNAPSALLIIRASKIVAFSELRG